MVLKGEEKQIPEGMTDVQLLIKYQAYQEAIELLKPLIDQHPSETPL